MLRITQAERLRQELVQNQKHEVEEAYRIFRDETDKFEGRWDGIISEYERSFAAQVAGLQEAHGWQLEERMEALNAKRPVKPRSSTEYLNQRRVQEILAKCGMYSKARCPPARPRALLPPLLSLPFFSFFSFFSVFSFQSSPPSAPSPPLFPAASPPCHTCKPLTPPPSNPPNARHTKRRWLRNRQANKVKEVADELYESEYAQTLASYEAELRLKKIRIMAKQQQEMDILLQRGSKARDALEMKHVAEAEKRQNRFRCVVAELDMAHRLEIVQLESFVESHAMAGKHLPLRESTFRRRKELLATQSDWLARQ